MQTSTYGTGEAPEMALFREMTGGLLGKDEKSRSNISRARRWSCRRRGGTASAAGGDRRGRQRRLAGRSRSATPSDARADDDDPTTT